MNMDFVTQIDTDQKNQSRKRNAGRQERI